MDGKDPRDWWAYLEREEFPVLLGTRVDEEALGLQDQRDLLASKATEECKVLLDQLDLLERLEVREIQEHLVPLVKLEPLV